MSTLLLRDARLPGSDRPRDVLLRDGRVAAVGVVGSPGGPEVRLDGRWLRPGLWDEHVHFTQWVKHRGRLDLTGARSAAGAVALVAAAGSGDSILYGAGFRDALWPDLPTRAALDAVAPERPVVLVSGDLHCGWLNSAAGRLLGMELDESGVLRETEWIATLHGLSDQDEPAAADYRAAADDAARRGVVGIVDFENSDNVALWPQRVRDGVTALRVEASVWPSRLQAAISDGHRTGDPLDELGLITVGRLKIVVDGSLNTRTALCWDPYPGVPVGDPHRCGVQSVPVSQLHDLLLTAHVAGIAPAVHAIGDRANTQVIDAFERLGIPGVVEHAQLVRAEDFARFGALGLVASVQPEHALDDRDVADHHWAGRTGRAFAYRSLLDAGAILRLGSDAPVAPLDPWASLAGAVSRSRDGRDAWHPEQELPIGAALAAGSRGRVEVARGSVADLIVLDHDPLAAGPGQLRDMTVAGTLLGGRWTWNTLEGATA